MECNHNLLIATPAYNGQIHVEYLHAMLTYKAADIRFAVQTISNESLITRARNTLLASFWNLEEHTHLLFLDGDVYLDANGLKNMIYFNKDVIGAPVALKGKGESGELLINTDADPALETKLQSVSRIGTAALMLSRNAVAALVDDAIKNDRSYSSPGPNTKENQTCYDVFQVGVIDGHYLSEDFWVCHKLQQLGFEIFVDTSAYTRHSGIVIYEQD